MYRVAILGCENSHANFFLDYIMKNKKVDDIEVVGIYSNEPEAAKKLQDQFGVYVAENYDEFVGKIDGLIITARHGDNHYLYAKPYIESGIPMFIDKPITVSEKEAVEFMKRLKEKEIKISGGSMCKYAAPIQEMKEMVKAKSCGKVFGGYFRAPISMENIYGGFYFYSQHLVQIICEIFGFYPKSVKAYANGDTYTCVFRYEECDVTGVYVDQDYHYAAVLSTEQGVKGGDYTLDGCSEQEFDAFYTILKNGKQEQTYKEFIAPVFILNAIDRSMKSGEEAQINWEEAEV